MKTYSIETIVALARSLSPYYRELYRDIPEKGWQLKELPPVVQKDFWEHNSLHDNRLLTGKMTDGIIVKCGGTTG
jgi:phenylacetate-CoA ligase